MKITIEQKDGKINIHTEEVETVDQMLLMMSQAMTIVLDSIDPAPAAGAHREAQGPARQLQ